MRATSCRRRWAWMTPLVLVAAIPKPSPAGVAKLHADIALSRTPVGNGKDTVEINLRLRGFRTIDKLRSVRLTSDAGVVGSLTKKGLNRYVASFTPPRVATATPVVVKALVRTTKRRVVNRRTIMVEPPNVPARPLSTGGDLGLTVSHDHLVLGRDVSAQVTVAGRLESPPSLHANVGSFGAFLRSGEDDVSAVYTPPTRSFPQVAIVAAGTPDGRWDWGIVPLLGTGKFSAKVSPLTLVMASVDSRDYGPFMADRHGKVVLPIVARPGTTTGTISMADGSNTRWDFDLEVPAFNQILAVCPEHDDVLRVFAVDSRGEPLAHANITARADAGTLSSPAMVSPGYYELIYTPPAKARLGSRSRVRVSLEGMATSSNSECTVVQRGARLAKVLVNVKPQSYRAGSREPLTASLTVLDVNGNPATPTSIDPIVDLGSVQSPRQSGAGRYQLRWELPDSFEGKRHALLTVRVGTGRVAVVGETTVKLLAGRPVRLEVDSDTAVLRADGRSSTRLRVRVLDAYGNRSTATPVVADAHGSLSPFSDEDGTGTLEGQYTAPVAYDSAQEDVIRLRAQSTDVLATHPIVLSPRNRLFALSVKGGYLVNGTAMDASLFLLEISARVPIAQERVQLALEAGYCQRRFRRDAPVGDSLRIRLHRVPITLHARYRHPLGDGFEAYAGVLGGAYAMAGSLRSDLGGNGHEQRIGVALGALAGVAWSFGTRSVLMELRYDRAPLGHVVGLRGNGGGAMALIGLSQAF